MHTHTSRGGIVAAVLAMSTGLSACTEAADSTKAGGAGPPITLRIGTNDNVGRPAANQIEAFAEHVDEESNGRVRIELVTGVGGNNSDDWDQLVARAIVDGELDGGNVPSRSWDTEGVTSLRALNAPFLVTSNELMAAVATDDVAGEMLAGLSEVGVTGLALLPEGLRHVFAFGEPMLAADDFDGAAIRAPMSATTFALFEALGAEPDDFPGPDAFSNGVADGSIAAAESAIALAPSLPGTTTTVTGNLTLYPKLNSLVLATEVWDDLSGDDQAGILQAAARTRDDAIAGLSDAAETAEKFCATGGTVVLADEDSLGAIHDAVRPVTEMLREDEQTASFIDRISELSADLPAAAPVEPCAYAPPSAPSSPDTAPGEQLDLSGVYRVEWTEEYLTENGLGDLADVEGGVHTITLSVDGRITDEYPDGALCEGTYAVEGSRATFHLTVGCTGDWAATVAVEGDRLTMSDIVIVPPTVSPEEQHIFEVFMSVPWTRIADVEAAEAAFPDGVYRLMVEAETVVAAGWPLSDARGYEGLWTLTFDAGSVIISERTGDCHATYEVTGGRVAITMSADPSCGTASENLFFTAGWEFDGDELTFVDLESADLAAQKLLVGIFASAPWERIG